MQVISVAMGLKVLTLCDRAQAWAWVQPPEVGKMWRDQLRKVRRAFDKLGGAPRNLLFWKPRKESRPGRREGTGHVKHC